MRVPNTQVRTKNLLFRFSSLQPFLFEGGLTRIFHRCRRHGGSASRMRLVNETKIGVGQARCASAKATADSSLTTPELKITFGAPVRSE